MGARSIGGIAHDVTRETGLQVYLIDADRTSRQETTEVLESGGFAVKTFITGRTFLDVASVLEPGCVVLDTRFPGAGIARTIYLSILASHVLLSVVALPLVLTTFFFSLSGRFAMHRRIARFTFPIWLYVSITGVIVFAFLKVYAY